MHYFILCILVSVLKFYYSLYLLFYEYKNIFIRIIIYKNERIQEQNSRRAIL